MCESDADHNSIPFKKGRENLARDFEKKYPPGKARDQQVRHRFGVEPSSKKNRK